MSYKTYSTSRTGRVQGEAFLSICRESLNNTDHLVSDPAWCTQTVCRPSVPVTVHHQPFIHGPEGHMSTFGPQDYSQQYISAQSWPAMPDILQRYAPSPGHSNGHGGNITDGLHLSRDITLEVRQQPHQALVASAKKERSSSSVFPPAVISQV